jgi:hypothetical protein
MFLQKYADKQFFCEHNTLTEGVFITQLSGNVGILVWCIVGYNKLPFHELHDRKNLLHTAFALKDLPVLENSIPVNNPVFVLLSWDNFQVYCKTLLIIQPKHVIWQFFQYRYH